MSRGGAISLNKKRMRIGERGASGLGGRKERRFDEESFR